MKACRARAVAVGVLALAVLACGGCSSPGRYWRHRGMDLLDTFEVGVSAGKGFRAEVRYGLGVWGIGRNVGWRARIGQRSFLVKEETGTLAVLPFPLNALVTALWWLDAQRTGDVCLNGLIALGGSYEREEPVRWETRKAAVRGRAEEAAPPARHRDLLAAWGDPPGESFPIGAELHLFVGARVRLLPAEVVDFATGFFGLDLLGDDPSTSVAAAEDEAAAEPAA